MADSRGQNQSVALYVCSFKANVCSFKANVFWQTEVIQREIQTLSFLLRGENDCALIGNKKMLSGEQEVKNRGFLELLLPLLDLKVTQK